MVHIMDGMIRGITVLVLDITDGTARDIILPGIHRGIIHTHRGIRLTTIRDIVATEGIMIMGIMLPVMEQPVVPDIAAVLQQHTDQGIQQDIVREVHVLLMLIQADLLQALPDPVVWMPEVLHVRPEAQMIFIPVRPGVQMILILPVRPGVPEMYITAQLLQEAAIVL